MSVEDRADVGPGWRGVRATLSTAAAIGLLLSVGACDVTNPGPVQDRFLDEPTARAGIVNGMGRAYSDASAAGCGAVLYRTTGAGTREIFPSGNPGNCGVTVLEGTGIYRTNEQSAVWNDAQNARWTAENGLERLQETMGDGFNSSALVAEARLWAGFSNRLLGENFCQAVIDGGSTESHTAFFERAEEQFTQAIQVAQNAGATDLAMAGRAGRATVRMDLGDWEGAVQDAGQIPRDFEGFHARFFAVSQDQYNSLHWSVAAEPYRTISVWNTPYDAYFENTGDPRVPWAEHPEFEFGDLARFDMRVPFHVQQKYDSNETNIDLADGREMSLIVAEKHLIDGDWSTAMDTINALRSSVGVGSRSAANATEAWEWFKFERGIELWLEGRRLSDLRRWEAANRPGQLQPLERADNSDTFLNPDQDLCIPVPDSELETNPNAG